MSDDKFAELEKIVVRLTVEQQNTDRRILAIEEAILKHMEQEERMTEKISGQLAKLNNAVIVIIVTLFLTLGKEVPGLMSALF